jgi:hypothetical protein
VEKRPELSLSYLSVKANACIASFPGENVRSSLIRLRLLQRMRQSNTEVGDVKSLDEVLHGVVILDSGAQPVIQPDGKLFAVSALPDRVARSIDCRQIHDVALAEGLPQATDRIGDYYSSSTVIRGPKSTGTGQFFYMVWHKEGGAWKIVGWYLDNPFANGPGPQIDIERDSANGGPKADTDPSLEASAQQFLKTWLVDRDIPGALKSVAPEARLCAKLGRISKTQLSPSEATWFQEVARGIRKSDTLAGAIQRVDVSHPQMKEVDDLDHNAYSLVRISDDLAAMYNCSARSAGSKPGQTAGMGKAFYTLKVYQTMFQPRHKSGDRGTVVLTWAHRQKQWKIIAFDIVTY